METKFAPLDGVKVDGQEITGHASLFDIRDNGGDTVKAGAYANSLAKGRKIKMLWQHDPAQPIGVWDEVKEDAQGLFVKGRILESVAKGREASALIEAGALDGLSIGYRTIRATKSAGGGRDLHELDLWEVSLVTFPMLPEARVDVKSAIDAAGELKEIEAILREAGSFSRAEAAMLVSRVKALSHGERVEKQDASTAAIERLLQIQSKL